MGLQLPPRVDQLKMVVSQKPRADLVDLEQGEVAADADMAASTKLFDTLLDSLVHRWG